MVYDTPPLILKEIPCPPLIHEAKGNSIVGVDDGASERAFEGFCDEFIVGCGDDFIVGCGVGPGVGCKEGTIDGSCDFTTDGVSDGFSDAMVGITDGDMVGRMEIVG